MIERFKNYRAFGFWWRIPYRFKYGLINLLGIKIDCTGKRTATRFKSLFKLLLGELEWDTKNTASYQSNHT